MSIKDRIDAYLTKAKEIQRESGAKVLAHSILKHIRHNPRRALLLKGRSYQTDKRVDTELRKNLISNHLENSDKSALDIGSNQGVITSVFSSQGLFTVGIERDKMSLVSAQDEFKFTPGLGFVRFDVDPNSIDKLPPFDVVSLLTVYHHWCREFGWEKSEYMLRTLANKSNKVFFECPKSKVDHPTLSLNSETVAGWYDQYFTSILDKSIQVQHLETVDYVGGERKDLIFLIKCKEFNK